MSEAAWQNCIDPPDINQTRALRPLWITQAQATNAEEACQAVAKISDNDVKGLIAIRRR
jgi:hypothetical protein